MKDAQRLIRLAITDKEFRDQLKASRAEAIKGYALTDAEAEGIGKLVESGRLDSVASQIENTIKLESHNPDNHPGLLW